jgi:hypothetical protein
MIIYSFIKKIFALVNLSIQFKKNLSFDEIYKKYIKINPVIIIDVGANKGQSIKRFNLLFDNLIIHSFEPVTECFDQMVKDFPDKNFIKNNYALSDNNTKKNFFINKNSETSSFYRINKNYDHTHENKIKNITKVKTVTLDTYINFNRINKINILKIDTQGHEINVLKGAKKSLKKNMINYIEVEIMLYDYYINKIKLYEIDHIMNKNNFELVDIQGHSYSKKNQINWFDMLYINKKFSQKRN